MDDESHIPLVDTHTKGYGCDYDLDFILHPLQLDPLSIPICHFGVVEVAGYRKLLQRIAQFFALLPAQTVDDTRHAIKVLLYLEVNILSLVPTLGFVYYLIV